MAGRGVRRTDIGFATHITEDMRDELRRVVAATECHGRHSENGVVMDALVRSIAEGREPADGGREPGDDARTVPVIYHSRACDVDTLAKWVDENPKTSKSDTLLAVICSLTGYDYHRARRLPIGRKHWASAWLTSEEYALVLRKVRRTGESLSYYTRNLILSAIGMETKSAEGRAKYPETVTGKRKKILVTLTEEEHARYMEKAREYGIGDRRNGSMMRRLLIADATDQPVSAALTAPVGGHDPLMERARAIMDADGD